MFISYLNGLLPVFPPCGPFVVYPKKIQKNIIPCIFDVCAEMKLGKIGEIDIKHAWQNNVYNQIRDLHKTSHSYKQKTCSKCNFRNNEIYMLLNK